MKCLALPSLRTVSKLPASFVACYAMAKLPPIGFGTKPETSRAVMQLACDAGFALFDGKDKRQLGTFFDMHRTEQDFSYVPS